MKHHTLCTLVLSALMLSACNQNSSAPTAEGQAQTTAQDGAQAQAGEVMLHTAEGEKALNKNPTPLAVYDMTALQNLKALGVAVQGMPEITADRLALIDLKADNTPEAANIGTVLEPNLEALNALKPKAVFIGSRMAEKAGELANVAPTYNLTIDTKDLYASSAQQIKDFGQLFDKQAEAAKLQADIDKAISDTKAVMANRGTGLAILINGNKMSAYGKNSRYGFLHTTLGIPMADENIQEARHGQPISFEYIQKVDPDWLFVLDRTAAVGEEGVAAKDFLNNPLMHNTKAYKNNQIVYLSPDSYLAFGGYYQWLKDTKIIQEAAKNSKAVVSTDTANADTPNADTANADTKAQADAQVANN